MHRKAFGIYLTYVLIGTILLIYNTVSTSEKCKPSLDLPEKNDIVNNVEAEPSGISLSLLTCSPGDELYSSYGHSAIRLCDSTLRIDVVFNYGTFDFNTPYFYLKFLNGTLDYMMSATDFSRFCRAYQYERRGVVERELILSTTEKGRLRDLLLENFQPENRFYRYDFFFDNCATRIRDMVGRAHQLSPDVLCANSDMSFREALHEYVGSNTWSGQGIDLIVGREADRKMSNSEKAYLPDYLEHLMISCAIVGEPRTLLRRSQEENEGGFQVTPNLLAEIIIFLTALLTIVEIRTGRWFKAYDVVLMSILGLLSVIFWYLWLISEIRVTSYNFNVLWASILYLPALFCLRRVGGNNQKWLAWANLASCLAYVAVALCGLQYVPTLGMTLCGVMIIRNCEILRRER